MWAGVVIEHDPRVGRIQGGSGRVRWDGVRARAIRSCSIGRPMGLSVAHDRAGRGATRRIFRSGSHLVDSPPHGESWRYYSLIRCCIDCIDRPAPLACIPCNRCPRRTSSCPGPCVSLLCARDSGPTGQAYATRGLRARRSLSRSVHSRSGGAGKQRSEGHASPSLAPAGQDRRHRRPHAHSVGSAAR